MKFSTLSLYTLILTTLFSYCVCIAQNHFQEYISHLSANQCCVDNGGKLCGVFKKSCCKKGCTKTWYGQFCLNDDYLQPNCNSCIKACEGKGGVPCAVSLQSGRFTCCSDTCTDPEGGLSDKVQGYIQKIGLNLLHEREQLRHAQVLDKLANKIFGKNNICPAEKAIDITGCKYDDSLLTLVKLRTIG